MLFEVFDSLSFKLKFFKSNLLMGDFYLSEIRGYMIKIHDFA